MDICIKGTVHDWLPWSFQRIDNLFILYINDEPVTPLELVEDMVQRMIGNRPDITEKYPITITHYEPEYDRYYSRTYVIKDPLAMHSIITKSEYTGIYALLPAEPDDSWFKPTTLLPIIDHQFPHKVEFTDEIELFSSYDRTDNFSYPVSRMSDIQFDFDTASITMSPSDHSSGQFMNYGLKRNSN